MTTHKTLNEARTAATPSTVTIIEIDHRTATHRYICSTRTMAAWEAALKRRPNLEVVRLVAEHRV